MNKVILVFLDGELIKQIQYKSKRVAKKQFAIFNKNGIMDPESGEVIKNAKFELI